MSEQLVAELQDRIDNLKVDRDEWRDTALGAASRVRSLLILGSCLLGAMIVLLIGGFFLFSSVNDISEAQRATVRAAARQDCRARISAEQNAVVRERDRRGWVALSAVTGGTDSEAFLEAQAALDAANRRVKGLPNLQDEVDDRCPKVRD